MFEKTLTLSKSVQIICFLCHLLIQINSFHYKYNTLFCLLTVWALMSSTVRPSETDSTVNWLNAETPHKSVQYLSHSTDRWKDLSIGWKPSRIPIESQISRKYSKSTAKLLHIWQTLSKTFIVYVINWIKVVNIWQQFQYI